MKTTIIPAQITTVEDKIAGNLTFTQLLILMVPVLCGLALYAFIPTAMELSVLKALTFSLILFTCLLLIIRIRERLVFQWLHVLIRYNLRPAYYLFNKNSASFRKIEKSHKSEEIEVQASVTKHSSKSSIGLSILSDAFAFSDKSVQVIPNDEGGFHVAIK